MPQEIIYYLIGVFIFWIVLFAIDYRTSDTVTLADLLIDGVMALFAPVTLVIMFFYLISESQTIYIKKPKKQDIE